MSGKKTRYRPEHQRMLNSRRWAEVKAIVDARAKGNCEWCVRDGREYGRKTGNDRLARTGWIRQGIDHHHIVPFESARTIAEAERLCYSPDNVVLLCVEHHIKAHRELGSKKKEVVQARRAERFERWKDNFKKSSDEKKEDKT